MAAGEGTTLFYLDGKLVEKEYILENKFIKRNFSTFGIWLKTGEFFAYSKILRNGFYLGQCPPELEKFWQEVSEVSPKVFLKYGFKTIEDLERMLQKKNYNQKEIFKLIELFSQFDHLKMIKRSSIFPRNIEKQFEKINEVKKEIGSFIEFVDEYYNPDFTEFYFEYVCRNVIIIGRKTIFYFEMEKEDEEEDEEGNIEIEIFGYYERKN